MSCDGAVLRQPCLWRYLGQNAKQVPCSLPAVKQVARYRGFFPSVLGVVSKSLGAITMKYTLWPLASGCTSQCGFWMYIT